jgi:hypothetical protein
VCVLSISFAFKPGPPNLRGFEFIDKTLFLALATPAFLKPSALILVCGEEAIEIFGAHV